VSEYKFRFGWFFILNLGFMQSLYTVFCQAVNRLAGKQC
jgi:hypothetical protein